MIVNTFPEFYQELVHLLSNVSEKEPLTASEIFREVPWNNNRIMSNEESLYSHHFISKGILGVGYGPFFWCRDTILKKAP